MANLEKGAIKKRYESPPFFADCPRMKINPVQAILASLVTLGSAGLAEVLKPHELMAKASTVPNLETVIPRKFGQWTFVPSVGLVTPSGTTGYVTEELSAKIYSQEVTRGYVDGAGNAVMLLVAYGPIQDYRLKAHLPEVCYGAAGFRVSKKTVTEISYRSDAAPLSLSRVTASKEGRFEPVSYWIRMGHDVVNGVFDRQLARMKYGLQGLIPDGALFRVSTVGMTEEASYRLQEQFIRDLIGAIPAENRKFFVGS
jgi:EpsI family protein